MKIHKRKIKNIQKYVAKCNKSIFFVNSDSPSKYFILWKNSINFIKKFIVWCKTLNKIDLRKVN